MIHKGKSRRLRVLYRSIKKGNNYYYRYSDKSDNFMGSNTEMNQRPYMYNTKTKFEAKRLRATVFALSKLGKQYL